MDKFKQIETYPILYARLRMLVFASLFTLVLAFVSLLVLNLATTSDEDVNSLFEALAELEESFGRAEEIMSGNPISFELMESSGLPQFGLRIWQTGVYYSVSNNISDRRFYSPTSPALSATIESQLEVMQQGESYFRFQALNPRNLTNPQPQLFECELYPLSYDIDLISDLSGGVTGTFKVNMACPNSDLVERLSFGIRLTWNEPTQEWITLQITPENSDIATPRAQLSVGGRQTSDAISSILAGGVTQWDELLGSEIHEAISDSLTVYRISRIVLES